LIYADKVSALANNGWRVKIMNISPFLYIIQGLKIQKPHTLFVKQEINKFGNLMKEMYLYNLATY
jgi:hypothetical protein